MYYKNNSIIFIEGDEFKILDLQSNEVNILFTVKRK